MDEVPTDYDPSFEWPGPEEEPVGSPPLLLRLLALRTSVLLPNQTLVVAEHHTELQFGRDAPPSNEIARVRLKEMEVSKLHATVYWDSDDQRWAIVDMGSVHGTFHQSQSSNATRLSPARVASAPRQLEHFDAFAIGSTTFLVHIHQAEPCDECIANDNAIPLLHTPRRPASNGYLPSRDSKTALATLKQQLLAGPGPIRTHSDYVDRSARRRALQTTSRYDAPGTEAPPLREQPPMESWEPPPVVRSQPLAASNIGHKLLVAQGWTPGAALGIEEEDGRVRLRTPLEVESTSNRAGLGYVIL
uniref:FHA domain-containing protein n=1 Tax=Mycena chlorophos TaxID=658473 RepID=A0ABQ0MC11_MYCCL|nr:predicted protein [Mycena chlorophos]